MDRRRFLKAGATALGVGALGPGLAACAVPEPFGPPVWVAPWNGSVFSLGVMSGLHGPDEVVLWTRLDPERAPGVSSVAWSVATDPDMHHVVATGVVEVGPEGDFTAKAKPGGLAADADHWFRFDAGGGRLSPVGRARTLPAPGSSVDHLRLAFGSCQNWTHGWYPAWEGIAAEPLDAVLWLGDYIYESGNSLVASTARRDTVGEAADLAGYRAKYRMYRSDPSLQAAHRAHPLVPIWDDHEFRNNYAAADLAADRDRAADAYRAWFEYMPVWPTEGTRIHRSLRWGDLGQIVMLDTRQYRDVAPGSSSIPLGVGDAVAMAARPDRSLLGSAQRDWLLDELSGAQSDGVPWKLVGTQVMVHPWRIIDLDTPELRAINPNLTRHDGVYLNLDSWDGYQYERDLVLAHLVDHSITNTSFLTGDVHSFWQATLRADHDDPTSPFVANEFVGGSISSAAFDLAGDLAVPLEQSTPHWQPGFRYADLRRRGYGVVDCRPDAMEVHFRVTDAASPSSPTRTAVSFTLRDGDPVPTMTRA